MRIIFSSFVALIKVSLSCNQKTEAVQEKENTVNDSIRTSQSLELQSYFRSYMESTRNIQMKLEAKGFGGAIADYAELRILLLLWVMAVIFIY